MNQTQKLWGVLAQFEGPNELLDAARGLRDAGYRRFDCHSPFPIHGMDEAMGQKRSKLGFVAGGAALLGGTGALTLQGWSASYAYPLVISGKPFFSYQAFFPITFALSVLLAAFGAFLGFFLVTKVLFHHPIFNSHLIRRVSDDGFIVSVEVKDDKFDIEKTQALLTSLGGKNVELVQES